jgi:RNA ligase (TIGR02306 family)
MANFRVDVESIIKVEDHPNADRLSVITIRGYTAISAKNEDGTHRYKAGDNVVYVPCGSVVPEYILRNGFWDETKNKGMLAGSEGNRVKEIRLRGIFSEGILLPVVDNKVSNATDVLEVSTGDNVSEFLGITKYEPVIPTNFAGEVYSDITLVKKFDLENIKNFPDIIKDGEDVVMTEKIHGTNFRIVIHPHLNKADGFNNGFASISSKGLGNQGLFFKNSESNTNNVYVRMTHTLTDNIQTIVDTMVNDTVIIFGEIFGQGVQDLTYGASKAMFRVFEVCVNGTWLDWENLVKFCNKFGFEMVPVVFVGPFSKESLKTATDGKTLVENGVNIREGVVVKTTNTRFEHSDRVIFKSVSESYLTRKNATEFN